MAQPRRILITGAGGFVGAHLMASLASGLPDSTLFPTDSHMLDVTRPEMVASVLREVRPDACVHLAAIAAIPAAQRDPDLAWRVNLHGTLNLARGLMQHAPDCILLFASSADIYGQSFKPGLPLDETACPAPMNIYGATKAAADLALGVLAAQGLRVIRARPFNHTGPGQSADFVVAAFARQVARIAAGRQEPVLRVGALDPKRDFLDVRDVCAAYAACLIRADVVPTGTILNIASGVPRRVGDVLHALIRLAGVTASVETASGLLRPSDIPTATGDARRARAMLGWQPTIDWETSLRDVLADWTRRVAAEDSQAGRQIESGQK